MRQHFYYCLEAERLEKVFLPVPRLTKRKARQQERTAIKVCNAQQQEVCAPKWRDSPKLDGSTQRRTRNEAQSIDVFSNVFLFNLILYGTQISIQPLTSVKPNKGRVHRNSSCHSSFTQIQFVSEFVYVGKARATLRTRREVRENPCTWFRPICICKFSIHTHQPA